MMKYNQLGQTDMRVSVLGMGTAALGGMFRHIYESEATDAVHRALDLGINFFDTAPYYGLTTAETRLGSALRTIPRKKYYLATKVGRYARDEFDFSAARTAASVDDSLERLRVDYVDLIQCHDIEFGALDQVIAETLPALEAARQAGKARYIGITGLPLKIFRYVLERAPVDTILSYCHYTLNDTTLAGLLPFLKEKGAGVINASPLSMGLLTERGRPPWHPAAPEIKARCAEAAAYCRARGMDIAQVAVQFSVSHPDIATTLISTADPANIESNARWVEAPPDAALLAEVQALLAPIRDQTWPSGRAENN